MYWLVWTSKDLGGRPPLASRCISLSWLFFHGGNTGSNPVRDPNLINTLHEIWRAVPLFHGMVCIASSVLFDSLGPLEPNVSAWTDHCRYGGAGLEFAVGSTNRAA